jgi:hypothetical protein
MESQVLRNAPGCSQAPSPCLHTYQRGLHTHSHHSGRALQLPMALLASSSVLPRVVVARRPLPRMPVLTPGLCAQVQTLPPPDEYPRKRGASFPRGWILQHWHRESMAILGLEVRFAASDHPRNLLRCCCAVSSGLCEAHTLGTELLVPAMPREQHHASQQAATTPANHTHGRGSSGRDSSDRAAAGWGV